MIKKTISYVDFNETDRSEDFYFNLTKAELAELQLTAPGGDLTAHLQNLIDSTSRKELVATFKEIIGMSYGVRSEDGRYFEKSEKILQRFMSSAAYSELFIELISEPDSLTEFIKGLIPADLQGNFDENLGVSTSNHAPQTARERSEAKMQGYQKKAEPQKPSTVEVMKELPTAPPVLDGPVEEVATQKDISQMSVEELQAALAAKQ